MAPEVRVNCLAPGWVRTAWGEGASATWQQRVLRETPLRRWGTPEDVAAAARWLASPAANYITGRVAVADHGRDQVGLPPPPGAVPPGEFPAAVGHQGQHAASRLPRRTMKFSSAGRLKRRRTRGDRNGGRRLLQRLVRRLHQ
ncbi:MAG: SDR family oxidoreductase [Gemmataceae bacterium]